MQSMLLISPILRQQYHDSCHAVDASNSTHPATTISSEILDSIAEKVADKLNQNKLNAETGWGGV